MLSMREILTQNEKTLEMVIQKVLLDLEYITEL